MRKLLRVLLRVATGDWLNAKPLCLALSDAPTNRHYVCRSVAHIHDAKADVFLRRRAIPRKDQTNAYMRLQIDTFRLTGEV